MEVCRPSHQKGILFLVEEYYGYADEPHSIPGHGKTSLTKSPCRRASQKTQPGISTVIQVEDSSTHDFPHFPGPSLENCLASLRDSVEMPPEVRGCQTDQCVEDAPGGSCYLELGLQSHVLGPLEVALGWLLRGLLDFAPSGRPFVANQRGSWRWSAYKDLPTQSTLSPPAQHNRLLDAHSNEALSRCSTALNIKLGKTIGDLPLRNQHLTIPVVENTAQTPLRTVRAWLQARALDLLPSTP